MSTNDYILKFLKGEGLMPEETDFGITFKYQMCNFLIFKDDDDQSFIQIVMPGIYDVKEDTMFDVLLACNEVNKSIKVAKAIVNEDSVWILYELVLDSSPVYEDVIPRGLDTLMSARGIFYQKLKG
jgi:hypothetical protein